ncbi:MAG: hypothetical protein HON98_01265 [Chloroflexi bacterium]|jgi:hypothetical protein|nr:hypothetical protein [Chloroflexota bacterium]MBT3668836.1 hypothetical protein [Chloroflexota bacterium]MBT4004234.1 hypothetical protein [Chloroflexota bacterium]MBT4306550.1 hypothetical protein [Chloroflexota bacterium]MBT4533934.1 hypothetical protein [Chloroflexota bacterium]
MAVKKTQMNCPQCRQPIVAEIEQLFDVGVEPAAKQRLLSGNINIAECPHCGYHGNLSTPLVYHDPEKELLLTFVPAELMLPMPEQEKVLGRLTTQVVDNLAPEQRKGYLFSPQATFTLKGLVERILLEEGITKEMIDAQQNKVNLIQKLAEMEDDKALEALAKVEDENIDSEFFNLMNQLIEASVSRGDENFARQLGELQQKLLPITTFGKELQERSAEMEIAGKTLQDLGDEVTREKLLDLIIEAPNDVRVEAYVGMTRGGMDYEFFQLLSNKIEAAEGDEEQRLTDLRTKLLELSEQIEKEIEARINAAQENLGRLLSVDNIKETTLQNLRAIDEFFVQVLNQEIAKAKEEKDAEREGKLQLVVDALTEASEQAQAASAGQNANVELIQTLIEADEEGRKKLFEERAEEITTEFVEGITGLMMQLESAEGQEELLENVRAVYRESIRISMQKNLEKPE